ncbi:MAG: TetR/AcrR family transcriptional regulator [Enterococcus sp.]
MGASQQKKIRIAKSLAALIKVKPYDKITIQDIAKEAKMNRQTFYYHFADKKALLRWFYQEDALVFLTSSELTLLNWEEQARQFFIAIQEKQEFYQVTVQSQPEILAEEFSQVIVQLFARLFNQVDQEKFLSVADKAFYGEFFAYGFSGILLSWIKAGCQESPLEMAAQLFRLAKDVEFFSTRLYEADQEV